MAEYKGYGTIDNVPVIAIYLIDWDQEDVEDEGDYDWDQALMDGRLLVDIDALANSDYDTLTTTGELSLTD